MLNIVFLILMVALFSQCETEIPINIDSDKEDIVMQSFITPDSVFSAFISKTTIVGKPIIKGIKNANVYIFDSTAKVNYALSHTQNGIYKSTFKPIINHKYKLNASASNTSCNATDSVLDIQPFIFIDSSTTINQNSSHFFKISIELVGKLKSESCFRLTMKIKQKRYIYDAITKKLLDSNIVYNWSNISSNEPFIRGVTSYGFNPKEIIFKIDKSSLRDNKITFGIEDFFKKSKKHSNMELTIYIDKISPYLFNFIKTQSEHLKYINDPIYNPPKVYSNVNNGYGLLGTYTQYSQNIILK